MKITIAANNEITAVNISRRANGEIHHIEFEFSPSYPWSDLEFWLEDENGQICDYCKMNVSKRNKMQFVKG